jgi:excisionase family DNA binding protein
MRALNSQPLTDDERREVKKLDQLLETATSAKLLVGSAEETIELPGAVFQLLRQIVHQIGEGKMAIIQEVDEILTTQEAADLLYVSRPYLIKLLEQGEIPFTKVGLHRRIRFQDVVTYQEQRKQEQREALRELAELSQEFGLYD